MNDYTPEQMKKLQQDAIMRVRDMNRRSKQAVENGKASAPKNEPKPPQTQAHSQPQHMPAQPNSQHTRGGFKFLQALDIKKLIGENSEQAMLLLLVLILLNEENSSDYLIYALIYIML